MASISTYSQATGCGKIHCTWCVLNFLHQHEEICFCLPLVPHCLLVNYPIWTIFFPSFRECIFITPSGFPVFPQLLGEKKCLSESSKHGTIIRGFRNRLLSSHVKSPQAVIYPDVNKLAHFSFPKGKCLTRKVHFPPVLFHLLYENS